MPHTTSKLSIHVTVASIAAIIVIVWFRLWFLAAVVGFVVWQVKSLRAAREANAELPTSSRLVLGVVDGGMIGIGFGILHGWLHYPVSDAEQEIVSDWWLGRTIVCSVFSANSGILIGMLIALTPHGVRAASIKSAVGGGGTGCVVSYMTRSTIPGAEMLLGSACSVLCAVVAIALAMWHRGVRPTRPMLSCGRWIFATLRLASVLVGCALLLLLIATPLAEVLNRRYRFDDDWTILALPVGVILGLFLGVRFRNRRWLHVLATIMLIFLIGLTIHLAIPQQSPDSIPPGMNRLPIALGNMLRVALLYALIITGSVSCVVAAVTHAILQIDSEWKPKDV